MKPVPFKEQNTVYAEDQEEYLPLPAFTDDKVCVSCWRLTLGERIRVLFTGRMWLMQMHFGEALQPQLPMTHPPFEKQT